MVKKKKLSVRRFALVIVEILLWCSQVATSAEFGLNKSNRWLTNSLPETTTKIDDRSKLSGR